MCTFEKMAGEGSGPPQLQIPVQLFAACLLPVVSNPSSTAGGGCTCTSECMAGKELEQCKPGPSSEVHPEACIHPLLATRIRPLAVSLPSAPGGKHEHNEANSKFNIFEVI